jgi:autotransporter-associated beta strand protein
VKFTTALNREFFMNSLQTLRMLALAGTVPVIAFAADITIPGTTGAYTANSQGDNYIVADGTTRSIASGGGVVVTLGSSTAGSYNLLVDGTVSHAGTGRAIRGTNNAVTFNVTVGVNGVVKAVSDDAINAQTGIFNVTNSGTIYSGPNIGATPTTAIATGQALDLTSATGGIVINNATGVIRADGHDAVRLGSNMTMINYGVVRSSTVVNDSPANNAFNTPAGSITETYSAGEGVSFENGANSSLDNYGSISGARHGVESDVSATNITITNRAAGTIIGRNGSGIGFDATSASATNVTVNNYGLVRGDYAGAGHIIDRTGAASLTNDGDGDGVDIDGAATINNYSTGQIISTGAGGFDSSGRANNSEGISIGGGVVVNDGLIRGADRGIVVNNDSVVSRSGVAATTITNNATGTIEGLNGFAIRLENKFGDARDNDTITNAGTITGGGSIPDPSAIVLRQDGLLDPNSTGTLDGVSYTGTGSARFIRGDGAAIQMGEGDDTLTNTGTITGGTGRAINMEGGNDTVNYNAGTITGSINGGSGTDTLNLGTGISTNSEILNFEQFNVTTGTATISGVVGGSTLTKSGAGTLVLSGNNTYTGLTTVGAGILRINNSAGSATGFGNVVVNTSAILTGGGTIGGSVFLNGILAPGNSIGTLTVNGDATWNGDASNAWQFELGAANASDHLLVGGDFLKGTGSDFVFDFQSGASTGTFVLVKWGGGTDFTATDFSYINLGSGLTGTFAFVGNQLEFSAVPEPSTYAAIIGVSALGFALVRRRRRVS